MRPHWKLVVEGLGNVKRAEVAVRPLLLFAGENGTGKTALASLLWGLLAFQHELSPPNGQALSACERWLTERVAEQEATPVYTLHDDDCALFARLFNETLAHEAAHLVRRIFQDPGMSVSGLYVHNNSWPVRPRIAFQPGAEGLALALGDTLPVSSDLLNQMGPAYQRYILKGLAALVAIGQVSPLGSRAEGPPRGTEPIFLPAARAGLMLLYRSALGQKIPPVEIARSGADDAPGALTSPLLHFLSLLSSALTYERGPHAAEADLLEEGLSGTIELVPGVDAVEYRYQPRGGAALPLSRAPSAVAALAPLILVLRHLPSFPALVIEEPAALLHPRLYRRLARVLARLVRKGVYVWITTTSAGLCRQINHFMRLGARADRAHVLADLGYGAHDYLEPDEIAGYELHRKGGEILTTELTRFEDGLSTSALDEELVTLE